MVLWFYRRTGHMAAGSRYTSALARRADSTRTLRHVRDGPISDMKQTFAELIQSCQHTAEHAQPAAARSPACRRWAASYSL
jgi:hypothetical protein